MYCRNCGKENPLHSANCLHCGSKVAIQQAVPLQKTTDWKRKPFAIYVLGALCLAVLLYSLPGGGDRKPAEAIAASPSPTATQAGPMSLVEAKTPAGEFEKFLEGERSRTAAKPRPKEIEETFYITDTGKRYHRAGCRHLRRSAHPITRSDAENQGYTPCRVCYP